MLVLTDTDYPGWRATVDGVEVPIVRVDTLFRGVVLPAGTHEVRFEFAPWSVRFGVAVSGVASVVIAGAVAWTLRRPRGAR